MKMHQIGEFGLIAIIRQFSGDNTAVPNLALGIGDDSAAWRSQDTTYLCTTDMLIEGVHFNLDYTSWNDLGKKAIAVNLSDIAAMGGNPKYALVSLGIPKDTEIESISQMTRSMFESAGDSGVAIIGGDTTESPVFIINVTLIGETIDHLLMTRSGAVVGDQIAVTGSLGASAAGLELLRLQTSIHSPSSFALKESHLCPRPRVKEGMVLARYGVKAAIDISDGLAADIAHICRESRVSAIVHVEKIPVETAVMELFPDTARDLAVSGGEDYELMFTAPAEIMQQIITDANIPITVIGEITDKEPGLVILLDQNGEQIHFNKSGWEHFIT